MPATVVRAAYRIICYDRSLSKLPIEIPHFMRQNSNVGRADFCPVSIGLVHKS